MGKIFGLCDNPVSIPTSPFEPIIVPPAPVRELPNFNLYQEGDKYVGKKATKTAKTGNIMKNVAKFFRTAKK